MTHARLTVSFATPSGKQITATPRDDMSAWLDVTLDGRAVSSGILYPVSDPAAARIRAKVEAMGATHVLACGTALSIPVVPAAAEQIKAALAQAKADAEARPIPLRDQREQLVAAVHGAGDEWSAARERAFADDTGKGWGRVGTTEQAIATAEAALAEFDAAHPEVVAEIKAEQDEATERFLAAD